MDGDRSLLRVAYIAVKRIRWAQSRNGQARKSHTKTTCRRLRRLGIRPNQVRMRQGHHSLRRICPARVQSKQCTTLGGIVGVIPGQFGIGIFSPPLDAKGNSVRGILACRELSEWFGLHCLASGFPGQQMRDLLAPARG